MESDFLFNKVIKRLYQEISGIRLMTVHDQIYYSEEFKKEVNVIWENELKKLMSVFNEIINDPQYELFSIEPEEYMNTEVDNDDFGICMDFGEAEINYHSY